MLRYRFDASWMATEKACDAALLQHKNSKGYWRRAKARKMLGRVDEAIKGQSVETCPVLGMRFLRPHRPAGSDPIATLQYRSDLRANSFVTSVVRSTGKGCHSWGFIIIIHEGRLPGPSQTKAPETTSFRDDGRREAEAKDIELAPDGRRPIEL